MAVIISDNRNPSYDGSLSTTNGWWRVEASNLAGFNSSDLSLSSTRTINLTFANAGNLRGIIVALGATASTPFNTKNNVTLTLKNAGTTVASVTLTRSQIVGTTDLNTFTNSFYTPRFEFNTPVLTTAGIYTVEISNSGTESSNWSLATSNGTAPFYIAWCDNQVTAVSGSDALCIYDPITINSSFTTKCNGLATGDTTNGVSIVLLTNSDGAVANVGNLKWVTPAAAYTLTVDGLLAFSAHSGIRMGTEASPIPASTQASIVFPTTPSFGTARGTNGLRRSNASCGGGSLFIYGEVPSQRMLRLASDAATGQANITLSVAPTTWQVGDRIYLYKRNTNTLNFTTYTISAIAGNVVTLNTNITTNSFTAGSPVINFERHGCRIIGSNPLSNASFSFQVPYNLVISGLYTEYVGFGWRNQQNQNPVAIAPNSSQFLIQDVTHRADGSGSIFLASLEIPSTNMLINRVYTTQQLMQNGPGFTPSDGFLGGYRKAGTLSITNCICQGSQPGTNSISLNGIDTIFSGNEIYASGGNETSSQHCIVIGSFGAASFINGTFKNNYFWRANAAVSLGGVFIPKEWQNNIFDGNTICYGLNGSIIGVYMKNEQFGQAVANTSEVVLGAQTYSDTQIESSLGVIKVNTSSQQLLVENTNGAFRVVNDNQVSNVDKIWNKNGFIVRTGDGLGDTTRKTGLYSLRFESNNNTNPLLWVKNQPIGNIQGKSMTVGIWMRINSANYWSAGHTMPRINVNYDNGTIVYGQALQIASTWQWVQVSFIPTTTFGQITVSLSTQTVATGSNAYVYFADFSGPLPQGSQLNLGEFNLWADGFPVTPLSFSTLINANDVWGANLNSFGSNTAGQKLQNSSTLSELGQLLTNAFND